MQIVRFWMHKIIHLNYIIFTIVVNYGYYNQKIFIKRDGKMDLRVQYHFICISRWENSKSFLSFCGAFENVHFNRYDRQ